MDGCELALHHGPLRRRDDRRLGEHLATLLPAAAGEPGRALSPLPLLSAAEEPAAPGRVERRDGRRLAVAGTGHLHGLFAAQAARTPDAAAVVFAGESADLRRAAGARRAGWPGGCGIWGWGRTWRWASSPSARSRWWSACSAILEGRRRLPAARSGLSGRAPGLHARGRRGAGAPDPGAGCRPPAGARRGRCSALDGTSVRGRERRSRSLAGGADPPENLAYVIYTSGSTGRPKGAMNRTAAIVNRLLWMQDAYGLTPGDRVLQKTPFSFDVSVWELFWPLLTGARLVLARPGGHRDRAYLAALIAAEGITTLHFVPSMLQAFLAEPGLEALPAAAPGDGERRGAAAASWCGGSSAASAAPSCTTSTARPRRRSTSPAGPARRERRRAASCRSAGRSPTPAIVRARRAAGGRCRSACRASCYIGGVRPGPRLSAAART